MEVLLETSADSAASRLQQALTEARLKLTAQQKKERATVVALEAELAESRSRVALARESARTEVSRIQARCSDRIRVAETERLGRKEAGLPVRLQHRVHEGDSFACLVSF